MLHKIHHPFIYLTSFLSPRGPVVQRKKGSESDLDSSHNSGTLPQSPGQWVPWFSLLLIAIVTTPQLPPRLSEKVKMGVNGL
jgi:hypothetical protein